MNLTGNHEMVSGIQYPFDRVQALVMQTEKGVEMIFSSQVPKPLISRHQVNQSQAKKFKTMLLIPHAKQFKRLLYLCRRCLKKSPSMYIHVICTVSE